MVYQEVIDELEDGLSKTGHVDYIMQYEGIMTIQSVASFILGLLIVIILIFYPVMIALELAYLAIPFFRTKIVDNWILKMDSQGHPTTKAKFMLHDAVQAVYEANTTKYGQNVYVLYFKRKIFNVFTVMFIIAVIVAGATDVINFFWTMLGQQVLGMIQ